MDDSKMLHAMDEAVFNSIGVYPQSFNGVPRTEWQDGWNACHSAILHRQISAWEWFSSLPAWKKDIVGEMLASEVISIDFVEESKPEKGMPETLGKPLVVKMSFSTSDLFAWGVADSQEIKDDEDLRALHQAWKSSGLDGMQALVCVREKEKPQWPVEKSWREAGLWTADLESLPDNQYDTVVGRWKGKSRAECVAEMEKQKKA